MLKIYKYVVDPDRDIPMPDSARILKAGRQGRDIVVWALVDTASEKIRPRKIRVFFTGHEVPCEKTLVYIDTVQIPNFFGDAQECVTHLFEET